MGYTGDFFETILSGQLHEIWDHQQKNIFLDIYNIQPSPHRKLGRNEQTFVVSGEFSGDFLA